jgi:hypothetical protein
MNSANILEIYYCLCLSMRLMHILNLNCSPARVSEMKPIVYDTMIKPDKLDQKLCKANTTVKQVSPRINPQIISIILG